MFAVIKTGGKQYRVSPSDTITVEKLDGEAGDAVSFDQVMLVGGGDGAEPPSARRWSPAPPWPARSSARPAATR